MATSHDHAAPEVAPQPYPEAVPSQQPEYHHQQQQAQQQPYYAPVSKPEYPPQVSSPQPTTIYSPYDASHTNLGGEGGASGASGEKKRGGGADRTVCGCTLIVFVLGVIIAVLAAAVIGLAAGTGIEASRANEADGNYQRLQASVSAAGLLAQPPASSTSCPTPRPTPVDKGCSTDAASINGQTYTSIKVMHSVATYTMRCSKDVNGTNLYSLFAPDFDTCMDSCSAYTHYATGFFGATNVNATCAGVSFIPLWTNKTIAVEGGAPGNCYLKRGPLESNAFVDVTAGTPTLGAIVIGS